LRANHSVQWFIEFGDMFLISLNGKGTIDGYLMGYVSARFDSFSLSFCIFSPLNGADLMGGQQNGGNRTPDHAIVHQIAVVPSVRRRGVATKLYNKFTQLAKSKSCQVVRVLVPRSRPGAIAFHRSYGFEELPEEAEKLKVRGGCVFVSLSFFLTLFGV